MRPSFESPGGSAGKNPRPTSETGGGGGETNWASTACKHLREKNSAKGRMHTKKRKVGKMGGKKQGAERFDGELR